MAKLKFVVAEECPSSNCVVRIKIKFCTHLLERIKDITRV
jgi:hypothetical protein